MTTMAGELTRGRALRLMADHSSDPSLRAAAFKAASKADLTAAELKQARSDLQSVLTFLAALPDGKSAPSAASIGEVLDIDKARVQYALDWLTKDGRLDADGVLNPQVKARESGIPTGPSLGRAPAMVAPKPLGQGKTAKVAHAKRLADGTVISIENGRQVITRPRDASIAALKQEVRQLKATINKIQGR